MADGLDDAKVSSVAGDAAVDRLFAGGTVLCDGAMGTMLYARGVFINRCYDELNLSQPELVREIHAEYLQAGAEVIETNTFGGNAFRLELHGLKDKVREINLAGRQAGPGVREADSRKAGQRGLCRRSDRAAGRKAGAAGQGRARRGASGVCGADSRAGGRRAGSRSRSADHRDDDVAGRGGAGDSGGQECGARRCRWW